MPRDLVYLGRQGREEKLSEAWGEFRATSAVIYPVTWLMMRLFNLEAVGWEVTANVSLVL